MSSRAILPPGKQTCVLGPETVGWRERRPDYGVKGEREPGPRGGGRGWWTARSRGGPLGGDGPSTGFMGGVLHEAGVQVRTK